MNISVIIPVYNAQSTITRAIDSVLAQTHSVDEIIVIDDGSTDGTAQAVQKYGAAIRYFYYENAGLAVARNRGIDKAKSEWIAFLDADDEWLPWCIESHVKLHAQNPAIKWSHCHVEGVLDGSHLTIPIPQGLQEEMKCNGTVSYFDAQLKGLPCGACGFLIHRSVFDEVGKFDPAMRTGQDGDMWCRIALKYPRIAVCEEVCWRYYLDNPNTLHRQGGGYRDLQLKSFCRNMQRAMELGPDVVSEFHPFARMKVMDYLIRAAGRQCWISPETIKGTECLFPLTVRERSLLRILRFLPKPIALKVVGRLSR
jgi:glycosyltransferase involved in cell wall biosynthesis